MSPTADGASADLQQTVADLQRQLAGARAERDEFEAQKAALAEVLGIINSSPGGLTPVFDAILEKATWLCGVPYGQLALFDGHNFRFVAVHGEHPFERHQPRDPRPPSWGVTWPRLVAGEDVVHMPDVVESEIYRSGHELARRFVEIGGGRSLLTVALRKDRQLLGGLTVYSQQAQPFSDKQIALLQNFAAQAVIAIENARLLNEQREALEHQTATSEVLQVINASPGDLGPVFEAMLERTVRLGDSSFGIMNVYEDGHYRAVAARGVPPGLVERWTAAPPPTPRNALTRIAEGEDLVHIVDLAAYETYLAGDGRSRALVETGGARSLLAVALRKDGGLLGTLTAYRQEVRPFTEKQMALLQNFAAQAVIAMENARLLNELRERNEEIAGWNHDLEARVAEQVEELGRVSRLKRFLAPQLAEMIVSQGDEKILESHRREIVVVFCDLRGYTAFTETAEPEEVLDFLREYHGALGPLVSQFEGTLDQFSGDGIMVFFNDPVPIPDPAERAVKMAVAMREAASTLIETWRERGRKLGIGVGIAQGYATLGQIGFSERTGYTAIGTVCNVAARLCGEAKDGQILLSQRVHVALKGSVTTEQVGSLALKGLSQPVIAYNVPLTASQPALRVIDGGNH